MNALNLIRAKSYAPDLPWNITDPERLGQVIVQYCRDYEAYYRRWAEKWFENFQFIYGNQSVRWSRRWGFAVDTDFLRRIPSINMRAQTNTSRVILEALAALIYAQLPEWEVESTAESSIKSKRMQKIVGDLLDGYFVRLDAAEDLLNAAVMYCIFGQFCAKVRWNRMAGSLIDIPMYRKAQVPTYASIMAQNPVLGGLIETPSAALNMQSQPMLEQQWVPMTDENGRVIYNKILSGEPQIDILTPFEYRRGIGSSGPNRSKVWQHYRLMDYDDYLDEYTQMPGRTHLFDRIRPVYHDPTIFAFAVQHYMRMQFTAPPVISDVFRRSESIFGSRMFRYKVFVIEHWDRPHPDKWPEGRVAVITNGQCTHLTKPDYTTGKADDWHPFVEAQWLRVPPSTIATGPLNDVIAKNREANVKDSLIATAVRRNMGSTLLTKIGSGIDPQRLVGEPGMVHEVADPFGARWLHDEIPIPTILPQLRQADKDDQYELSGAGDALRGAPSTGATSGYQEKQREEREEKRLTPPRRNFERAVARIGEKLLACVRANVRHMDDRMIGYLKRAGAGEYEISDVVALISQPIGYGIDITVRKSSMTVKSKATKQAEMMELIAGPAAQRVANDPEVLDEVLKFFEMEGLRDQDAFHRDRADKENEIFLDMARLGPDLDGVASPIVFFEDNDLIHMAKHAKFICSHADMLRNNPWLQLRIFSHQERHRLQSFEKQAVVPAGTAQQAPAMVGMAFQGQRPNLGDIQQQIRAQPPQAPQAPPQQAPAPGGEASTGQKQAPQAPRQPAAVGSGGGGNVDSGASSAATPSAASRGGFQ